MLIQASLASKRIKAVGCLKSVQPSFSVLGGKVRNTVSTMFLHHDPELTLDWILPDQI